MGVSNLPAAGLSCESKNWLRLESRSRPTASRICSDPTSRVLQRRNPSLGSGFTNVPRTQIRGRPSHRHFVQSTGHTHPGKGGGIGPRPSQGQLGCQKESKGGAKSPGAKTIWRGRGFARQRDCSPGGGWGGISTRNGLRLVSKVRQQCRRMWFGTGDLAPRPMLPLLGCSFVRLPPAKVLDIERTKSESLSLFQKLNFSGEGRVLSPGCRPPPQAAETSRVPRKALPVPTSLRAPQDSADPTPTSVGAPRLSPRSAGRQGRSCHYFKASSKTVLGRTKTSVYTSGRAPGSDGSEDQSGWGPPAARPRPSPGLGRWSQK